VLEQASTLIRRQRPGHQRLAAGLAHRTHDASHTAYLAPLSEPRARPVPGPGCFPHRPRQPIRGTG
jgi:hypothetical protein